MIYFKIIIFALFTYRIIMNLDFIITLPFLENFDLQTITIFSTALFTGFFYQSLKDKELKKLQKECEEEAKKRGKEEVIQEKKEAKQRAKRKKDLIEKYGDEFGFLIADRKIEIGMTKEMLIEAWDEPEDTKETVYKKSTKEKYYYFPRTTRQNTTVYSLQVNLEDGLIVGWRDLE